jgi:predicted AAA+ superfamily ATPase
LPCYFNNFGKRLIKSPKIYFTEVGLVAYLLGIENAEQVASYPLLSYIISEIRMVLK